MAQQMVPRFPPRSGAPQFPLERETSHIPLPAYWAGLRSTRRCLSPPLAPQAAQL